MADPSQENVSGGDPQGYGNTTSSGDALSGKIMLSAVVILFTVVVLIIGLHIYARWFLLRARRRQPARRRRHRTHIVFSIEPSATTANSVFLHSRGLDESVLKSLPTFVYSSATHGGGGGGGGVLECAVCLSEFEDEEKGRLLPKCNHSFHIDCIDMWFHSHSTCPLCRTLVTSEILAPAPAPALALPNESPVEVAVTVAESEPGSSSGLCPSCRPDKDETGCFSASSSSSSPPSSSSSSAASSSLGTRRKTLEAVTVSIEVPPRRNDTMRGQEEEQLRLVSPRFLGLKSPRGQQGLSSPGGRILSLKRILSREWKGSLSPSSAAGLSYSTAAEIDLESANEQRVQAQPKR